jgi:hypothetical protein
MIELTAGNDHQPYGGSWIGPLWRDRVVEVHITQPVSAFPARERTPSDLPPFSWPRFDTPARGD